MIDQGPPQYGHPGVFSQPYQPYQPYQSYQSYQPSSQPYEDPLAAYRAHALPYSAREDHALREHSFIENTEAQLDSFITQGRAVLGNLVEQRGILKETRRRMLDAANTMGLSRELIGYIDRLSSQDAIIFWVGAIFTLACFYFIYRWLG